MEQGVIMAEIDYAALKKGGFMRQIQKDHFSLRLRAVGGQFTAAQMRKIGETATQFGRGYVHFTSRQGVEIPFVKAGDIDAIKAALAEADLQPGVCGPRVRTVTACQGNAICPSGLIETTELAKKMDARYFGRELPHKFKIGITGCPNNCLKAEENDLGIKGALYPTWNAGKCSSCGLCEPVCPAKAIKAAPQALLARPSQREGQFSAGDDGVPQAQKKGITFDEKKCVYCGKCVKSCPENAWEGKSAYLLSFGGTFGNEIKTGLHILGVLFNEDDVFRATDNAIKFFEAHGQKSERFAKTIERVGVEKLKKELL
jgi:dissimilatory sulfite reductase (desulfoviridin) alpha/beta subunit